MYVVPYELIFCPHQAAASTIALFCFFLIYVHKYMYGHLIHSHSI